MARLVEIAARIANVEELLGIVSAMRSLAGVRMRQALEVLGGIRRYSEVVGAAISRAMAFVPEDERPDRQGGRGRTRAARRVLLVFGSEHGFAGGFNDRLLDHADRTMGERGGRLVLVGSRGAVVAEGRAPAEAREPLWATPMATTPQTVPEVAQHIAAELYRRMGRGEVEEADVLYCRSDPGGTLRIVEERLLPPDLSRFPAAADALPPLHHLPAGVLLERLAGEYVIAELTRVVMESLASENAARLAAMEAARENVGKKLDELREEERRIRQDEVTIELLDVVTGAEALRPDVEPITRPSG
ncbi:MAG TPA: F0F1 ATP synthase subunit gamma [Polyangia bacterium]|jgi:F-type H+-transporting ATPase subunit gamma|nr:F0F1 ATP synthase subunit gamma [Polyangia bacterium]